jgi:hypothetical protein
MSGYRSKRVANTRTAMGTTDQRPTGSGAVMLGLTGSGPGSSPWARRAAQRRAYTSMLQKKCAEGDKASCINPVAAAVVDDADIGGGLDLGGGVIVATPSLSITTSSSWEYIPDTQQISMTLSFETILSSSDVVTPTTDTSDVRGQFTISFWDSGVLKTPSCSGYHIEMGNILIVFDNEINDTDVIGSAVGLVNKKINLTYSKHETLSNNCADATPIYVGEFTELIDLSE